MPTKRYQLVLLGPTTPAYDVTLRQQVSALFGGLGLDFSVDGEILSGDDITPDWGGFPVAVWFGGDGAPSSSDLRVMQEFLSRGFSLFPVVDDLTKYSMSVPKELGPINGQPWDAAKVGADVMRGFRLARKLRQVFISYRRIESAGVAHQLFHELNERGFRVFLDTASVETGVDFQNSLWSRMADVDLVVLLDTPNALSSEWVYKELNRAHDLGMGVVQLIWPNHIRTKGTELSYPVQLDDLDFVAGNHDTTGILVEAVIKRIVSVIESERILSLGARRTRLVEGLLDHVAGKGGTVYVHPMQNVDVMRDNVKIAEVVPFVGVPDSISIYQHELGKSHDPTIVVYNGLGVDVEWAKHLIWLNGKSTVAVHQIDDFGNYLGGLA
jgi:hypothetical protein